MNLYEENPRSEACVIMQLSDVPTVIDESPYWNFYRKEYLMIPSFTQTHGKLQIHAIEPMGTPPMFNEGKPAERVSTYGERIANRALKVETMVARIMYRQMAKADVKIQGAACRSEIDSDTKASLGEASAILKDAMSFYLAVHDDQASDSGRL